MKVLFVNADGTTEKHEVRHLLRRLPDYDRGKVWQEAGVAGDGLAELPVYVEIPWASLTHRTPEKEREVQQAYRRQPAGGQGTGHG